MISDRLESKLGSIGIHVVIEPTHDDPPVELMIELGMRGALGRKFEPQSKDTRKPTKQREEEEEKAVQTASETLKLREHLPAYRNRRKIT